MPVTKEQFEQGLTYADYKETMTRNRERLEANEQTVKFSPDDLAFFKGLEPLNVVAIAEDWCGDVIANLPVIGALAEQSGKLNLRVFPRDQNLDLMDQYLKDGEFRSIPVFVFFDQDFNELGYWIERPAKMYELQAQMRRDLFANDPLLAGIDPATPMGQLPEEARARVMEASTKFREQNRAFSDGEVVREIRAIIEQGSAQAAKSKQSAAAPAPVTLTPTTNGRAKVSITYCAECGYEPQTLELTGALMRAFVHDLSAIELIPWQDGAFDVVINGDLVHSMYRDGGFPENEAMIAAVRARLG